MRVPVQRPEPKVSLISPEIEKPDRLVNAREHIQAAIPQDTLTHQTITKCVGHPVAVFSSRSVQGASKPHREPIRDHGDRTLPLLWPTRLQSARPAADVLRSLAAYSCITLRHSLILISAFEGHSSMNRSKRTELP